MNNKYFTGFKLIYHLLTWLTCGLLITALIIITIVTICIGLFKLDITCIASAVPFVFMAFILVKTFQWVYAYTPKGDIHD